MTFPATMMILFNSIFILLLLLSSHSLTVVGQLALHAQSMQHSSAVSSYHSTNLNEVEWNNQELNKWKQFMESSSTPFQPSQITQNLELFSKYALEESLDDKLSRIAVPTLGSQLWSNHTSKQVIVTTATYGFRNFLYNWMCSIRNLPDKSGESLLNQIIVYTYDTRVAWDLITNHQFFNVYVDKRAARDSSANEETAFSFHTLPYQRMILYRTLFIEKILVNNNYNVLLADNDAVWLQNPMTFLSRIEYQDFDMVAQDDSTNEGSHLACGGFLYLKNTQRMKNVWQGVAGDFLRLMKRIRGPTYDNEQEMLQRAANKKKFSVAYLPRYLFPSGKLYFDHSLSRSMFNDVYVVHNNYAIGSAKKQQRFRRYRGYLWQVNTLEGNMCIPREDPDWSLANLLVTKPEIVPVRPRT